MSFYTIGAKFVPIAEWPGKRTPDWKRKRAKFKVTIGKTQAELQKELRHLNAKNVIIQLDCDPSQIKLDGYPRSKARVNGPGVILTFETREHGTLSYPSDLYMHWDDNLRAIALTLAALRDVSRWGVTQNGEQYKGSSDRKIHAPGAGNGQLTAEAAAAIFAAMGGGNAGDILKDRTYANEVYRRAARAVHPDHGGHTADFQKLQDARAVVDKHHGGIGR